MTRHEGSTGAVAPESVLFEGTSFQFKTKTKPFLGVQIEKNTPTFCLKCPMVPEVSLRLPRGVVALGS